MDFGQRLVALGLVSADSLAGHSPLRTDHRSLLTLADEGLLPDALSLSLGVRPDECIGALCQRMGGSASRLKVEDVRDRPVLELKVSFEDQTERWEVADVPSLI